MTLTLAIANQKGGVGKTTTAVNLGHGLARRGLRTLLVDLDAQGHVAVAVGLDPAPGLQRLLIGGAALREVATPARDNLFVVAGDRTTEAAKLVLTGQAFREQALARALAPAAGQYDFVLLDCAPSADVLHVAALVAADWMLIPTRLDPLAAHGVAQMLTMLATVRQAGRAAAFAGVIPTFFERRTNETHRQLEQLARAFGSQVWPLVPQDPRAREAPAHGQTLWEYAPRSAALAGYATVLDRLLAEFTPALEAA